jgi:uncharacterized YigZ family protein
VRDAYRTLQAKAEYRQKIERSDFLGIAFAIQTEAQFMTELDAVRKKYFDATHHCWAFRLFADQRARSADAGEPSGSAGKPILSAIEAADLFDSAVIVVRWFGGVKLGTGGLSRAYRGAATEVLKQAGTVERFVYRRVSVLVPFDRMSDAYRLVDPPSVLLSGEEYGHSNVFHFDVRASRVEDFLEGLAERRLIPR